MGKVLHIEWINKKVLLYSTGNNPQYPVINHSGKERIYSHRGNQWFVGTTGEAEPGCVSSGALPMLNCRSPHRAGFCRDGSLFPATDGGGERFKMEPEVDGGRERFKMEPEVDGGGERFKMEPEVDGGGERFKMEPEVDGGGAMRAAHEDEGAEASAAGTAHGAQGVPGGAGGRDGPGDPAGPGDAASRGVPAGSGDMADPRHLSTAGESGGAAAAAIPQIPGAPHAPGPGGDAAPGARALSTRVYQLYPIPGTLVGQVATRVVV